MKNKALTLTIISKMTSNYGEGLGNISNVQKIFTNGKAYATRSRESLKNAIMVQSGMYNDLKVTVDGAAQKEVSDTLNASNCRALEGGYMNTSGVTKIRKSSFYLTDAIACDEFINETRFHNNLFLATTYTKEQNISLQSKKDEGKTGLMPYQYEFDKSLKQYSFTIDLDEVGIDSNYKTEASKEEKIERVITLLNTIESLSLVVKGNLDNAEPLFIVGGIEKYKTHYFENVVKVIESKFIISDDLKDRINNNKGYSVAIIKGDNFTNEKEIVKELEPITVSKFFDNLRKEVRDYYESSKN